MIIWQQHPMHQLQLAFSDGKLSGTGTDIVGAYHMSGRLDQDRIYVLKQYVQNIKLNILVLA